MDTYDELHIPSARITPDAVLQWPIFENRYPPNYLTDSTFAAESPDDDTDDEDVVEATQRAPKPRGGIDEDAVFHLVQRFLELVHIKNPILDTDTMWTYAQRVTEEGIGWDSSSCMVVSVIIVFESDARSNRIKFSSSHVPWVASPGRVHQA